MDDNERYKNAVLFCMEYYLCVEFGTQWSRIYTMATADFCITFKAENFLDTIDHIKDLLALKHLTLPVRSANTLNDLKRIL